MTKHKDIKRCPWCGNDELYVKYHDDEWGIPVYDDGKLFEFLLLEGAQAGLSWITILRKRESYREAFDNFNYEKIALYDERDFERLMNNYTIVHNKLKIKSAIKNAGFFIKIIEEKGSFSNYIWDYFDGKPVINKFSTSEEIPVSNAVSDRISKDMKRRGFTFFGSVICYSFLQAMGMINDHLIYCFKHPYNSEVS